MVVPDKMEACAVPPSSRVRMQGGHDKLQRALTDVHLLLTATLPTGIGLYSTNYIYKAARL